MQLLNFIKAIFSKLIPREVGVEELNIVRCVIQPYHFKKKVLPGAFEPPPDSSDVSLVRLKYSDEHIAKRDGVELAKARALKDNPKFKGLAVVNAVMLNEINATGIGLSASIKGTPIDKHNNYVSEAISAYKCDSGKPYHADLIFSDIKVKGEPATKFREYSNQLVKILESKNLFYEDTHPTHKKWCSELLAGLIERAFRRVD